MNRQPFATASQRRPCSDAELVHGARRGDRRAFVEIVARYQAMVCGIALSILGDFAASEDAGQEAFLTAWRKLSDLREPERLRAWLAQIARNAALGQLRCRREYAALDEGLAVPDNSAGPAESAANEEEAALVREFLSRLPETYRLPLVLYYREGRSVRAVAETLDLTEDAVKQRLARGREMLREQMSGLVETVLSRTGPTAVFTMGVAVAIGALAAPAAVAAGAFGGGSVAGALGTTSSTSILAVMSTSKVVLITAAVAGILCVPAGYYLGGDRQAPLVAATNNLPRLAVQPAAPPPVPAPTLEETPLFAEWRALHQRYGTNAEAMRLMFNAIGDFKDTFKKQAFHSALIAEWAQVEPAEGLKFFLGRGPDDTQRRQFFEEWLARDPRAAVEALLVASEAGEGWGKIARECLPAIARRVPASVPDIASRLPNSDDYWNHNVRDAFTILAGNGLDGARKAAEAVTGPSRQEALCGVGLEWAKTDFGGVVAWARSLPEGSPRDEVIRAALVGEAAVDPVAALNSIGLVPRGGRYAYFADTTGARVLAAAANTDFDATVAWIAANPGRLGREDLYGLVGTVTERLNADAAGFLGAHAADGVLAGLMPAVENALLNSASGQRMTVWNWVNSQPESAATRELKRVVLDSASWQDPALALELVTKLPANSEGDAQVKEVARALFNGGNALGRFDALFPVAPERLRGPLLEAAFGCLSAANLDDPQQWNSRLSLLPAVSRQAAVESLACAWGQLTPEGAIGWANSLPQGDPRNGAAAAIVPVWSAKDPQGAAGWVAGLPAGPARDRSAESLALALAGEFPREAWGWALSITDTSRRDHAALGAAKAMAARDAVTAQQWIEAGPFPAETKMRLVSSLTSSSKIGAKGR